MIEPRGGLNGYCLAPRSEFPIVKRRKRKEIFSEKSRSDLKAISGNTWQWEVSLLLSRISVHWESVCSIGAKLVRSDLLG